MPPRSGPAPRSGQRPPPGATAGNPTTYDEARAARRKKANPYGGEADNVGGAPKKRGTHPYGIVCMTGRQEA